MNSLRIRHSNAACYVFTPTMHALAQFFRGIHLAFGMTAPPEDISPARERTFVLTWFGIIVVTALWCWLLVHLLS